MDYDWTGARMRRTLFIRRTYIITIALVAVSMVVVFGDIVVRP